MHAYSFSMPAPPGGSGGMLPLEITCETSSGVQTDIYILLYYISTTSIIQSCVNMYTSVTLFQNHLSVKTLISSFFLHYCTENCYIVCSGVASI